MKCAIAGFVCISIFFTELYATSGDAGNYLPELVFDGANGVGAGKAKLFLQHIVPSNLKIKIINDGLKDEDVLNEVVILK